MPRGGAPAATSTRCAPCPSAGPTRGCSPCGESLIGADLAATACCPACGARVEFAVDSARTSDLDTSRMGRAAASSRADVTSSTGAPRPPGDLLDAARRRRRAEAGAASPLPRRDAPRPGRRCDSGDAPDRGAPSWPTPAMADARSARRPPGRPDVPGLRPAFDARPRPGAPSSGPRSRRRAKRLLHEVDVLARAYGWTEAEVLALPRDPPRRLPAHWPLDGGP